MTLPPVTVSLIVARAANGVIGVDGKLPWRIPADLQFFKRMTVGKPIIMGRKTYDSIGKPLPRRTNIVVTRDTAWTANGVIVAHDMASAFAIGYEEAHRSGIEEVMVIGGEEIYRQALPQANRIYLTEVRREYAGDAKFNLDLSDWRETERENHDGQGEVPAFSFVILERV